MQTPLTHEQIAEVLRIYHGFHDAEVRKVAIGPLKGDSGYLEVEIELGATNFRTKAVENVCLILGKVREMKFSYNSDVDYPNVRDEIAVGFFDGIAYIDFGSACEPRTSPEDFRSVENYFVCDSVSFSAE